MHSCTVSACFLVLITGLCHIYIITFLTDEYHCYLLVEGTKGIVFEPLANSKTFPTFLQVLKQKKKKKKMNIDK